MTEPDKPEGRPRDHETDAAAPQADTTDGARPAEQDHAEQDHADHEHADHDRGDADPAEQGTAEQETPEQETGALQSAEPEAADGDGAPGDSATDPTAPVDAPSAEAEVPQPGDHDDPDTAGAPPGATTEDASPPDDPAHADFAGPSSDGADAHVEGPEAAATDRETDTSPDATDALAAGGAAAAAATSRAPSAGPTAAPAPERVVVEKRGGFVPGFVGGVFAVAGAVFAAPYVLPQNMRPITSLAPVEADIRAQQAAIESQAGAVEDLTAQVTALSEATADTDALDALAASSDAGLSALRDDLDALSQRLEDITRSALDDSLDPRVVAALESYNSEVADLTETVEGRLAAAEAAMAAQTEENRRLIEEATAAAQAAYSDAEAEAQAAEAEAEATRRRQALVEVREALETGAPFAEALAALDPGLVPAALTDAAEAGVPTLAALQADFAPPARAALDAARRATMPEGPTARVTTFMQTQLGVRSLAPRDGASPDAVLSRAEAALREADLAGAIAEIGALPDIAQAEMADWVARAAARAEAVSAADELAATLATN